MNSVWSAGTTGRQQVRAGTPVVVARRWDMLKVGAGRELATGKQWGRSVCFDERRWKSDSERGGRDRETGIRIIRQRGEAELPSIMTQSPTAASRSLLSPPS